MLKRGIMFLLIILILPIVYSEEINIPETFKTENVEVTSYFYVGNNLVATKDNSVVKYYSQDRLGSNRLTTDNSGIRIGETKTLPFGEEIINDNKFSFTGKELDSELYYFGARYYELETGRFTSVDPIGINYQYVSNNPLIFIDPDGMEKVRKGNAIFIVASPKSDYNGAFFNSGLVDSTLLTLNLNFERVYIDTVSTDTEYFQAFENGKGAVGGKFDFYVGVAHGSQSEITLDKVSFFDFFSSKKLDTKHLSSSDLENKDLSQYFNSGASGCQMSCSVADTTVDNNFAFALANSMKIPISGLLKPVAPKLLDDLSLSTYYAEFIRSEGVDEEGNGFFESKNGLVYNIRLKDGKYTVNYVNYILNRKNKRLLKSLDTMQAAGLPIPLPYDFDESNLVHMLEVRQVYTTNPN